MLPGSFVRGLLARMAPGALFVPSTAFAQPDQPPSAPPTASSAADPPSAPSPTPTDAHLHDGFYFRFAFGVSYVWLRGNGPSGSATAGGSGIGETLAFGGTPAKGLVIAGAAMFHDANPTSIDGAPQASGFGNLGAGTYGVLVDWFPDPAEGWHVGGGLGLALVAFADGRGYSAGASVLGGYDFWVAPQWSLGALVVATSALATSTPDAGGITSGLRFAPATIALEATILCH